MGIGIILVLCSIWLTAVETAIIAGIAIYAQGYIHFFNGAELKQGIL